MDSGILIKYNASAGSGKTTELTRKYVSRLFRSRNNYSKILAVTFTNKAASEMKDRILEQLWLISTGNLKAEAERISASNHKPVLEIESEAKKILETILHDYSRFSVGTIDSFFQKVLKAFTREAGLQSGYQIELDHSVILAEAVDNMLAGIGDDKMLLDWIAEFAETRVGEGKNWNLKKEIILLAEELFREKYKLLSASERENLRDRSLLAEYVRELKSMRSDFFNYLTATGLKISQLLDKHGVTDDMFFQGKKGVPSFVKKISSSQFDTGNPLNSYVLKVLEDTPRWSTSSVPGMQLTAALKDGLGELIIQAIIYYNRNFININTADAILANIYSLGILTDILEHVHEITTAENKFLLSDAGELLYLIIGKDQTPFIYEKIGNRFEHYMIDEFQDTSAIQWNNFKPLIDNSMGEGFDNMVVGDVKQSIYRWRNSDWNIFDNILDRDIGDNRLKVHKLDTNYRSRTNIVALNNSLFSVIPGLIDKEYENNNVRFRDLYADAPQNAGGRKDGGFLHLEFIEDSEEEKFKDIVLGKLPGIIERLQDKGYKGSDIGILVRWNNEGSDILKYMLEYRTTVDAERRRKYNYEIISNESLILDQNPVVCFIISLLTWLTDPSDNISRALVFRNYLLASGKGVSGAESLLINYSEDELKTFFPVDYESLLKEIKHLSLFESVEKIIDFFSLGSYPGNSAYLNSLQDCILQYSANNSSETGAFLEWWASTGSKKSVILSEQQDSIRVMTIHKSKGLQFPVVILPFLTWQLNHDKNPTIWIKPEMPVFDRISLVPVKYRKSLIYSHFEKEYNEEKFSSIVDNLNLVYVSFTRAIDCLIGFCPEKPVNRSLTVSTILKQAIQSENEIKGEKPVLDLKKLFDSNKKTLSVGEIPLRTEEPKSKPAGEVLAGYVVNTSLTRLKLKFHGENFLVSLPEDQAVRLNYGRVMHEVFSLISSSDDIKYAVDKQIMEGKIPGNRKEELVNKISDLISVPEVSEWFEVGSNILKETDILLPSGSTKRPDRIILKDDKAVIIDFKFGVEKSGYKKQVNEYRKLMNEMGYKKIDAFLWYVDKNKIVAV